MAAMTQTHSGALPPLPPAPPEAGSPNVRTRYAVPWDWSDMLLWIAGGLVIYLTVALGLVYAEYLVNPGVMKPGSSLTNDVVFNLVNQIALDGTAAGMVLLLVLVRRHGTPAMLGLRLPRLRWFAALPLIVALVQAMVLALSFASEQLFPSATSNQCQQVKSAYGTQYALGLIAVAVAAPAAEELVFRGFLFGWLRAHLPVWSAALISGIIFGAVHDQSALAIPLMGIGVGFAYVYHRSGSIYVTMLAHAMFNAINLWPILFQPCS